MKKGIRTTAKLSLGLQDQQGKLVLNPTTGGFDGGIRPPKFYTKKVIIQKRITTFVTKYKTSSVTIYS
jgi:hypothetical protein